MDTTQDGLGGTLLSERDISEGFDRLIAAAFRLDLKVPAWRDAEGYYTLEHDIAHPEEFLFPLGKAFLLCENPWDGYKMI
jgi:hypothetical protein